MSSLPANNHHLRSQQEIPPKKTKLSNKILFPLPQFLLLSTMLHGVEYPFGHSGSAVTAVSPHSFPPTASLLAGVAE